MYRHIQFAYLFKKLEPSSSWIVKRVFKSKQKLKQILNFGSCFVIKNNHNFEFGHATLSFCRERAFSKVRERACSAH